MATSKAQIKATRKYAEKTYTRIALNIKKEEAESIKQIIANTGKSTNSFILEAINEKMERENLK